MAGLFFAAKALCLSCQSRFLSGLYSVTFRLNSLFRVLSEPLADQPWWRSQLLHLIAKFLSVYIQLLGKQSCYQQNSLAFLFVILHYVWKYPELHGNKWKTKQTPNIIPSIPLLPGGVQCVKAESLGCLSAVLLYQLPWTGPIHCVEEWALEDRTPRLCSLPCRTHSLQLERTIFREEGRFNWYCWPDPVPKSPLEKRDEFRQRKVSGPIQCFSGKEANWSTMSRWFRSSFEV